MGRGRGRGCGQCVEEWWSGGRGSGLAGEAVAACVAVLPAWGAQAGAALATGLWLAAWRHPNIRRAFFFHGSHLPVPALRQLVALSRQSARPHPPRAPFSTAASSSSARARPGARPLTVPGPLRPLREGRPQAPMQAVDLCSHEPRRATSALNIFLRAPPSGPTPQCPPRT